MLTTNPSLRDGDRQVDVITYQDLADPVGSPTSRRTSCVPRYSVRDTVLIEDETSSMISRLTGVPTQMRTLVTTEGRYTRDSNGFEELYVFGDDPDELDNRADRDEPLRVEMLARMADHMMVVGESGRGLPSPNKGTAA